jgi:hypothetical protein
MDQVAGRHIGPELDGLLASIVGSSREGLEEIFSLYSSQDAPAAFRLAESVGVDMLDDYRRILISSCQEPPFLALALERAWSASANRDTWLVILAEAALRYRNVAHKLEESQIANDVPSIEMPARAPVFVRRMRPRSCYRECLAFSLSSPQAASHLEFRAVAIISTLPTPSRFQRMMSVSYGFAAFLAISVALFLAGTYAGDALYAKHHALLATTLALIATIPALAFYILAFCGVVFSRYYRFLTRALVNTRRDSREPDKAQDQTVKHDPFIRFIISADLGRWTGNFFARSEQFALFQVAVLRGGIEISPQRRGGRARTDGDLLPPRKLRLWNNDSHAS